jgi:peptidoglycan/xylan/chitin deacetylase (PgdA/CDA1 family)
VLCYHRAATPRCDPFALSVAPARLREHLAALTELVEVLPLGELMARRRERKPSPAVAITFDDGYADNYLDALPLLSAAGVPATLFVASGVIHNTGHFWWDQLSHLFLDPVPLPPNITLTVGGITLTADLRSDHARLRALLLIRARLYTRTPPEIDHALETLSDRLGVPLISDCPDHRLLSEDQLKKVAAAPGIEIGSHSVSHPSLPALDDASLSRELEVSRSDLSAATGQPVDTFAYPFGDPSSLDRRTVRSVRSTGYRSAFTLAHGPVGWWTESQRAPRYLVGDWPGDVFRAHLTSWLAIA